MQRRVQGEGTWEHEAHGTEGCCDCSYPMCIFAFVYHSYDQSSYLYYHLSLSVLSPSFLYYYAYVLCIIVSLYLWSNLKYRMSRTMPRVGWPGEAATHKRGAVEARSPPSRPPLSPVKLLGSPFLEVSCDEGWRVSGDEWNRCDRYYDGMEGDGGCDGGVERWGLEVKC
jgi:hypothetical protein